MAVISLHWVTDMLNHAGTHQVWRTAEDRIDACWVDRCKQFLHSEPVKLTTGPAYSCFSRGESGVPALLLSRYGTLFESFFGCILLFKDKSVSLQGLTNLSAPAWLWWLDSGLHQVHHIAENYRDIEEGVGQLEEWRSWILSYHLL